MSLLTLFCLSCRVPTILNTILICFDEVLRLVPGLADGVVVALVGDVVLVSRPCWLHITREGLFWQSHYSRASAYQVSQVPESYLAFSLW